MLYARIFCVATEKYVIEVMCSSIWSIQKTNTKAFTIYFILISSEKIIRFSHW